MYETPYRFTVGDLDSIETVLRLYPVEVVRHILPLTIPIKALWAHGVGQSFRRDVTSGERTFCEIGDHAWQKESDRRCVLGTCLPWHGSHARMLTPTHLRMARAALALTTRALAEQVGVSAMAISRYENGDTGVMSVETITRLEAFFRVHRIFFGPKESWRHNDV